MAEAHKIRSHQTLQLIRELALPTCSQNDLAKKYGVTAGAITMFKQKHHDAIREIQQNSENEFASLWIAEKAKRIMEYQNQVELINEQLANNPNSRNLGTLLRYAQAALRSVAEELGQLTQKVETKNTTHYTVTGVDLEQMK